jgi:hypothetical protein
MSSSEDDSMGTPLGKVGKSSDSNRAVELCKAGVKLWRKEDLLDIEQQMERNQSGGGNKYTVRRIDGQLVQIERLRPAKENE